LAIALRRGIVRAAFRRLAIALSTAAFCTAASAHHGYAGYDRCKSVMIAGEIERISWSNPHVVFTVKLDAAESYLIQWLDPTRLSRAGVPSGVLAVGDRVEVTGSQNRDPSVHIMTLLTAVRRPADGWQWSRPFPIPGTCGG
jgi:Family of unknown function (DUF6152)